MGELSLGGRSRPFTESDLSRYQEVQGMQTGHRVPVLQPVDDPHAHVYFVLLDGTGQDAADPNRAPTNIGKLRTQLDPLRWDPDSRIGMGYVEGIGTRKPAPGNLIDGLMPFSWAEKLERAYRDLSTQTWRWRQQDPDAHVALAAVGYSRGAVLAPGFLRLVDTYGIADPDSLRFGRDAQGNVTVESTLPPLIPPRQVPQIAGLFDPVATNMPANYDARLNPRTLSGFSIIAADELRRWFPHQAIVEPGLSADGRMLNANGVGGHANVGGGSRDPMAETMAFNAMADFLNTAFDRKIVQTLPLPSVIDGATVQQVGGPTAGFGLATDRDGRRDVRETLANCVIVDPCRDSEPVDAAFAERFAWRSVQPGWSVPAVGARDQARLPPVAATPDQPAHPDHAHLQRLRAGVEALDASVGKSYDAGSERISRLLLAATRDGGDVANVAPDGRAALSRIDHVVLGTDGRYIFAVEGRLQSPTNRFVGVLVEKALRTPVEQADARLEEANARIDATQAREATQVQTRQADALRGTEAMAPPSPVLAR